MKEEYTLKLDAGQYGFFTTEWSSLYEVIKKREDLDDETRKALLKMYASLLIQLYPQEIEFLKEKKKNNDFDENYTEEFNDKLINICEEVLKKYKKLE